MLSLADEAKLNLQKLIGMKLSRMALAADMRTLQFGNTEARKRGGVVGEYALHVQCPWRLESDTGIITGSGDLYVPDEKSEQPGEPFDWENGGSLQERILRELLEGYDDNNRQIVNLTNIFVVADIQSDSAGGFCLTLSGGYRFLVFPNGTGSEAWRLFKPSTDECESNEEHFVVPFQA
jgi:hypothetical protein